MAASADLLDLLASGDLDALRSALSSNPALAERPAPDGVSLLLHALYRRRSGAVEAILAARPRLSAFDLAALGDAAGLRAAPPAAGERSPDGYTALHLAAYFGRLEAAQALLDAGADAAAVAANASMVQPLHSAVAGRHGEVAALLLARGAPPDARQAGGWTALHSAAKHGDEALVELLLSHGADPAPASDEGLRPADLAAQTRHGAIARRLAAAAAGRGGSGLRREGGG
jgi:ankyrin repeat protein